MLEKDYNIDEILNEVKMRQQKNNPPTEEKPVLEEKQEQSEEKMVEPEPQPAEVEVKEEPVFTELTEEPAPKEMEAEAIKEEPQPEIVEEPEQEGYVDLNELGAEEENEVEEAIVDEPAKKKRRFGIKGLAILLAIIIAMGVGTYFYADHMINQRLQNVVEADPEATEWTGMDVLEDNFDKTIEETDAAELASFKDHVKTWYKNGDPAYSSHVLNVLLIGEDTRGSEIMDDGTRADSAIICSINKDTNEITLTSILRDTYAYWEDTYGDESTGQFNKINAAMSLNDVKTYCQAVEHLYKIRIDNYVIVNFTSFEKIIDILGGVTLEITSREINEINSHPKRYGNVTIEKEFDGTKGEQKLTGKQALAYCRIRKLDSDNMRADRQKTCLMQVFNDATDTSLTNVVKIIDKVLPYVKTNMPVKSIKKLAKYALANDWLNYEMKTTTVPEARINERGSGGIHWGTWCWKTDFPQDAYTLQMKIYGKSNIVLARTRVDVLNCQEEGYFSQGASPVTAVIYNDHYGEVTTLPAEESTDEENA